MKHVINHKAISAAVFATADHLMEEWQGRAASVEKVEADRLRLLSLSSENDQLKAKVAEQEAELEELEKSVEHFVAIVGKKASTIIACARLRETMQARLVDNEYYMRLAEAELSGWFGRGRALKFLRRALATS